jgi:hypothetical protein
VLWDVDTPYDYDVDYYFPLGQPGILNAYTMCGSMFRSFSSSAYGMSPWGAWSDWDLMGYPYRSMCREWYSGVRCFSYLALYAYSGCNIGSVVVTGPVVPIPGGQPGDTAGAPNEGVVRGGLFAPTPLPVGGDGTDPPPVERPIGRFDQARTGEGAGWDNLMSIPPRATRKMKEEDARGRNATTGAPPARTGFDGAGTATDKDGKTRTADAGRDEATRVQPPSREPTKAKGIGEPRRETGSKGGYGSTGRTSEPRPSSGGPDRVSRPADTRSTGTTASPNPPSIQGTTTEKKKPPTD